MKKMNLKIRLTKEQLYTVFGFQPVVAMLINPDMNWLNTWGANIHPLGHAGWYIVCGHHHGEAQETIDRIWEVLAK